MPENPRFFSSYESFTGSEETCLGRLPHERLGAFLELGLPCPRRASSPAAERHSLADVRNRLATMKTMLHAESRWAADLGSQGSML